MFCPEKIEPDIIIENLNTRVRNFGVKRCNSIETIRTLMTEKAKSHFSKKGGFNNNKFDFSVFKMESHRNKEKAFLQSKKICPM